MDGQAYGVGIDLDRLAYQAAGLGVLLAALHLQQTCRKAGFRPDEPRVPRGNPDGGQWTRVPGWAGEDSTNTPWEEEESAPIIRVGDEPGGFEDHTEEFENGIDASIFDEIPKVTPLRRRHEIAIIRPLAGFIAAAKPRRPPSNILESIGVPGWVRQYYPHLDAYVTAAKGLAELQADALRYGVRPGYNIHHIVEKASARYDGFPESMIESSENKVSIPTLKHWELNSWYETANEKYGFETPRDYARGKSWEQKRQLGLNGLRKIGVLK